MCENYIMNKFFKNETNITYNKIQSKLKIKSNGLNFPYANIHLNNIQKRHFVLPNMASIAGLKLRNILSDKVKGAIATVGAGTITFYMYDTYHKTADRAIAIKNYELATKSHELAQEIATKNHELATYRLNIENRGKLEKSLNEDFINLEKKLSEKNSYFSKNDNSLYIDHLKKSINNKKNELDSISLLVNKELNNSNISKNVNENNLANSILEDFFF
jgi:hypothetical protein